MNKILIILFVPLYLFAVVNPYSSLDKDEKLNVMVNHFLNLSLENIKPPLPVKSKLKDDGATLDPVKYELYFSYIQRIKAIRESRAEAQLVIDEDYIGKIGFYNGKLKSLKKFYTKKENLYPLLAQSVNKAFKVVYGKPSFSNIVYDEDTNVLKADLTTTDIYKVSKYDSHKLELFVNKSIRDNFIQNHKNADIKVRFTFDGEYLIYKDVLFMFNDDEYIGNFLSNSKKQTKLNIKINDDIFQAIKIGDLK